MWKIRRLKKLLKLFIANNFKVGVLSIFYVEVLAYSGYLS
jgi:hypothetical protein